MNRLMRQSVLAKAARDARKAFGNSANDQVAKTLEIVKKKADELAIPTGGVTAMLDAHFISFAGGVISLHDSDGIPLHALGLGSSRLLVAGLQRAAANRSSPILVDEVEHGLEPHRIMRLITSLGAKDDSAPLQVFMTTHSPVALCELSGAQLYKVHRTTDNHIVMHVGNEDLMQRTIRACPEAFLAPAVIIAEGAIEIGFIRGLDLYRIDTGALSIAALGVAIADGHGETTFKRANAFAALGYKTLILRDNDKAPDKTDLETYTRAGGTVITWRNGRALEEELFASLSQDGVYKLLEVAVQNKSKPFVNDNIKSASSHSCDLEKCRSVVNSETRTVLGKAAKSKGTSWYKSISAMETVACEIVGPDLKDCEAGFRSLIEQLFTWAENVGH